MMLILALLVLLSLMFGATKWGGLGKLQRNWILERDGGRCQMFRYSPTKDRYTQCPNTKDLHCHHILPQRIMKTHFPHKDPHRPENLIILCKECHNGKDGVHPDMWKALTEYRKGNKDAFDEVMKGRQMLVERGHVYWNTRWDWLFMRRARRNTRKFARGNRYPEKRRRR